MGLGGELNSWISVFEKLNKLGKRCAFKIQAKQIKGAYYFEEYNKSVTVYKNGLGILITTIKLKVLDPDNTKEIERELDISDGKISARFSSWHELLRTDTDDRFIKYGLWYQSDDNVVTAARENYKDKKLKRDKKILQWKFTLCESKLKKGQTYTITYVVSVPGMFPISNGCFDSSESEDEDYKFNSQIHVKHLMKKLIYTISFEHGIKLEENPNCEIVCKKANYSVDSKPVQGKNVNNLLYDRYVFEIDEPPYQSEVSVNWDIMREDEDGKIAKKTNNSANNLVGIGNIS